MFIYSIGSSKRKIIPAAAVTVIPVFILYIAAAFGIMIFHKVPVFFPSWKMLITIAAGLLSVLAGDCAFALLIRAVKPKVFCAILALLLILVTYLFGSMFEAGIFSVPTVRLLTTWPISNREFWRMTTKANIISTRNAMCSC